MFINMLMLLNFWYVIRVRNKELLQKFGQRLRKLREEKGLSQEQLAYTAEISTNQIGRIERGEINATLSTLNVIAVALKVSLAELVQEV